MCNHKQKTFLPSPFPSCSIFSSSLLSAHHVADGKAKRWGEVAHTIRVASALMELQIRRGDRKQTK